MTSIKTVKYSYLTVTVWLWLLQPSNQSRTVDQNRSFRPMWFCSVVLYLLWLATIQLVDVDILLRSWIQTHDWWVILTLLCCNTHGEHIIFLFLLPWFTAVQRRGQIAALWPAARPQMDWKKREKKKKNTSSSRYTGIWLVTWQKKIEEPWNVGYHWGGYPLSTITLTCLHFHTLDPPENWINIYTDVQYV